MTTAFDTALCRALPMLRTRAARLAKNRADVDDLMQGTALRALLYRDMYADIGNMGGWLASIMFTVHLNKIRTANSRPIEFVGDELPEIMVQPNAEFAVAIGEVNEALARLTAEHRSAIIQEAAGYSYIEIAETEKIKIGTVKSRLNRARLALSRQGEFV